MSSSSEIHNCGGGEGGGGGGGGGGYDNDDDGCTKSCFDLMKQYYNTVFKPVAVPFELKVYDDDYDKNDKIAYPSRDWWTTTTKEFSVWIRTPVCFMRIRVPFQMAYDGVVTMEVSRIIEYAPGNRDPHSGRYTTQQLSLLLTFDLSKPDIMSTKLCYQWNDFPSGVAILSPLRAQLFNWHWINSCVIPLSIGEWTKFLEYAYADCITKRQQYHLPIFMEFRSESTVCSCCGQLKPLRSKKNGFSITQSRKKTWTKSATPLTTAGLPRCASCIELELPSRPYWMHMHPQAQFRFLILQNSWHSYWSANWTPKKSMPVERKFFFEQFDECHDDIINEWGQIRHGSIRNPNPKLKVVDYTALQQALVMLEKTAPITSAGIFDGVFNAPTKM